MLNPPEPLPLFQQCFNFVSLRTQTCRKFNLDKDNLGGNSGYTVLRNSTEARGKGRVSYPSGFPAGVVKPYKSRFPYP